MPGNRDTHTPEAFPELSALQKWFYAVVTHPDGVEAGAHTDEAMDFAPMSRGQLEQIVTASTQVSAADRLSIYANAYFSRLIECLSDVFPVTQKTLGDDLFNAFAFDYLQQYPSKSYTLSRLGESFARFLRETRPDDRDSENHPDWTDFLIELTELEWLIGEVFDGPGLEDDSRLDTRFLAEIAPERWSKVRIQTNPGLKLLQTRFPVNSYYTAIRIRGEEPRMPEPATEYTAISRRDYVVRRHSLSPLQFSMLEAIQAGKPLAEVFETLPLDDGLDEDVVAGDVHRWFQEWSRLQFFESVVL